MTGMIKNKKKTVLCAAFCGTGKTFICENSKIKAVEIEYWKYEGRQGDFLKDINQHVGIFDIVFLQTDSESLNLLQLECIELVLIYPDKSLRNEYLDRYIQRDNPYDFIGSMMKYWDKSIDELNSRDYCKQIILGENQYISNVIDQIIKNN